MTNDIEFDIIISMSKFKKNQLKIKNSQSISYDEATNLLLKLGFQMRSPGGSHFIFWEKGYEKNMSLKKRTELLPYQIRMLEEVIENEEQNKKEKG